MSSTTLPIEFDSDSPRDDCSRLISHEREAQIFWRVRRKVSRVLFEQAIARSRLRAALIFGLTLLFWSGLFLFFCEGFRFLATYVGLASEIHTQTIELIFNIFFASLMVMIVFSAGIILYGGLYRSEETKFLLTLPVRTERIVLHKFQEAIFFSCWGFFLLGSPMLLAYGAVANAPLYYFFLAIPMMCAFAYIPGSIGAIVCLLVVDRIAHVRAYALALLLALLAVCFGLLIWIVVAGSQYELFSLDWFKEIVGRLQFSRGRLLPSWWLSTGLLEAARQPRPTGVDQPLAECIKFFILLLSNAMLLHIVTIWAGKKVFRRSCSQLVGRRRRFPGLGAMGWIDRIAMLLTAPFPYQVRLLLVKDLRVCRRDPVQWSQFLIFFGLLGLYFLNIRRFGYGVPYAGWVNLVSFLNLAVIGLILSAFTTRFIFPMISLEGSRFWILGLLPIERTTILWGKFFFATFGAALSCLPLVLLSDVMLRVPVLVMIIHQFTCLLLCVGLSGIAVGLGARMPDLKEHSPSKIAAGFGGTLNLVLSALYIILIVLLTGVPCHFHVAAQSGGVASGLLSDETLSWWVVGGLAGSLLLGILATVVPLRMGFKAFRSMEF